ncbi:MAG: hypothetical protein GY820_33305, partial [Gammaproteobacteria bacterium]|nr:hypothetical protein [Gammaproteobacteria bacterium]
MAFSTLATNFESESAAGSRCNHRKMEAPCLVDPGSFHSGSFHLFHIFRCAAIGDIFKMVNTVSDVNAIPVENNTTRRVKCFYRTFVEGPKNQIWTRRGRGPNLAWKKPGSFSLPQKNA